MRDAEGEVTRGNCVFDTRLLPPCDAWILHHFCNSGSSLACTKRQGNRRSRSFFLFTRGRRLEFFPLLPVIYSLVKPPLSGVPFSFARAFKQLVLCLYISVQVAEISMSSQTNASCSGHHLSTSYTQGVPMSIFNPQLIDEARRASAIKKRSSSGTSQVTRLRSSRHSRGVSNTSSMLESRDCTRFLREADWIQSHHKVVSVSVTAAIVSHDKTNDEMRRSMSTHHVNFPSLECRLLKNWKD